MRDKKLVVISLVGPSAAGKTSIINLLKDEFEVLSEKYMDLNKFKLDNRLLLSKWTYIDYWYNNIFQAKNDQIEVLITDRCPFDTCAYVYEKSDELFAILEECSSELLNKNIELKTILVTSDFEILESRIKSRIKKESRREFYNEKDRGHNRRAYDFYQKNINYWNNTINTSGMTLSEVKDELQRTIKTLLV